MRELFGAELNANDAPMSREDLAAVVKRAHVLVPTVTDRIDRELIAEAGPHLKLIAISATASITSTSPPPSNAASPSRTRRAF